MGFAKETGQDTGEFILLIEKAGAADTDGPIAARCEGLRERGFLEGKGGISRREAACKFGGK